MGDKSHIGLSRAVMMPLVARLTQCQAVVHVIPAFQVDTERTDMVSVESPAPALAAVLARVVVALKHSLTPSVVLCRLTCPPDRGCHAAFPVRVAGTLARFRHALARFWAGFPPASVATAALFGAGRSRVPAGTMPPFTASAIHSVALRTIQAERATRVPRFVTNAPLLIGVYMGLVFLYADAQGMSGTGDIFSVHTSLYHLSAGEAN